MHARALIFTIPEITTGVSFDTVAREWRCKWSADNDKASLAAAQVALDSVIASTKAVAGVKSVQRVVCGDCLDFKVTTSVEGAAFGAWEAKGFSPEAEFLAKLNEIEGVSQVETQTFTLMQM